MTEQFGLPEVENFDKVLKIYEPTEVGDFLIVVEDHRYKEVCMNFLAYECMFVDTDGKWVYEEYGATCNYDTSVNHEECQPFLDGFLKWDGCCNVMFSEQRDNSYLHFCGLKETQKIARLFEKLYRIAPECISAWDSEVAED